MLKPLPVSCLLLSTLVTAGCGGEPPEQTSEETAEAIEAAQAPLLMQPGARKWKNGIVPICFYMQHSPAPPEFKQVRDSIKSALLSGWGKAAKINFRFPDTAECRSLYDQGHAHGGPEHVEMALLGVKEWSDVGGRSFGLGSPGVGYILVEVGFCAPSLGGNCRTRRDPAGREHALDYLTVVRGTALHEIGHALGFPHEQHQAKTPVNLTDWCEAARGAEKLPASASLTTYDPDSIMNYCADRNRNQVPDGDEPWAVDGNSLSAKDKAGARAAYGKR